MDEQNIGCHKGVYYPLKNESAVIRALLADRTWEKKAYDYYRNHILKEHTVIDCGAFIGSHTLKFSKLSKKVYAFEPVPLINKCLQKTLKEKEIKNVELFNIALGNDSKETNIYTNFNGDSSIDGIRNKRFNYNFKTRMERLDYIIGLNEKIDFIKIDVEGSEWDVLEGAKEIIKKWRPMILLETWATKKNIIKLGKFLKDYGYIEAVTLNSENYLLFPITENNIAL